MKTFPLGILVLVGAYLAGCGGPSQDDGAAAKPPEPRAPMSETPQAAESNPVIMRAATDLALPIYPGATVDPMANSRVSTMDGHEIVTIGLRTSDDANAVVSFYASKLNWDMSASGSKTTMQGATSVGGTGTIIVQPCGRGAAVLMTAALRLAADPTYVPPPQPIALPPPSEPNQPQQQNAAPYNTSGLSGFDGAPQPTPTTDGSSPADGSEAQSG